VAAFLDSAESHATDVVREQQAEIVQRFLTCAFEEVGKAPALLEGEDVEWILRERLPAHFARKDPLAAAAPAVLSAYLSDLEGRAMVLHAFEMRQALENSAAHFQRQVQDGGTSGAGVAPAPTLASRGTKVGRNDPCPCGSGRKFKKCCGRP